MMKTATRWRRLLVGAMVVTCALLGVLASGAGAENRLERIYEIQSAFTPVNSFPGIQDVRSYGRTEYLAYWEGAGTLAITARTAQENGSRAVTRRLTGEAPASLNDTSNPIAFAISNDRRVHISYREAGGAHRYLQSEAGCPIESCRFTGSENQVPRTPNEWEISHPAYIQDHEGHLFFTYRHGPDANGEQELNRYNENGRWTRVGTIIRGGSARYTFDPDGAGPARSISTTQRGPLIDDIRFDEAEDMVVTWVWDENTSAIDNAMHGLSFAWSNDLGVTWLDNANTRMATAESDPIRLEDESTQVWGDGPGWFLKPGAMKLDSEGNPHILTTESTVQTGDALLAVQRQVHFWRASDLRWHGLWVERSFGSTEPSQGGFLIDRRDGIHYIYPSGDLGWRAWNGNDTTQTDLPRGNVRWEAPGYMNVFVHSAVTCLDDISYIGIPISTAGTGTSVVIVRMKNSTAARDFTINWTTDEDPTFTHSKEVTFTGVLTAEDREYREYSFTMSSELWRGTLRQLEICPAEGASTGRVSIDRIKLRRRGTAIDVFEWGFEESRRIMTAEADATNEWESWHIETLIPEVTDSWADGDWSPDEGIYEYTLGLTVPIMVVEQGGVMRTYDMELHLYDQAKLADWRWETETMGWSIGGDIRGGWFESRGVKAIGGTITGSDSRIYSRNELALRVPAEEEPPRFKILLTNQSEATLARIWYTNSFETEFSTRHSITFAIRPFSSESYYEITARPEQWLGWTIRRLRIDPADVGASSGEFAIDRFWF